MYKAKNIKYDKNGYGMFDIYYKKKKLGTIRLSVSGEHNISNALAVVALSCAYKISFDKIKKGLKSYTGAARRLEYKGLFNGAKVYDDYGHHPTEIAAVAKAIHKMKYNDSWVIFEPHTYSRAYKHKKDFAKSLSSFNHIIVTDIYAAREVNTYNIKEEDIVNEICKYNDKTIYIGNHQDIKKYCYETMVGNLVFYNNTSGSCVSGICT